MNMCTSRPIKSLGARNERETRNKLGLPFYTSDREDSGDLDLEFCKTLGAVYSSRGICIAVIYCRSPSHTIVYGKVDVKRKLIHSHDYKARGSVTLSKGLELGEKLMEDSKAGD